MATCDVPDRPPIKVFQDPNIFQKSGVTDQLLRNDFFAFDTEFEMDKDGIKLSLIQIATRDKHVFLFDVLKSPNIVGELRKVLESNKITKVIHDCLNDSKALWNTHGIKMDNVFDTKLVQQILESRQTQTVLKHVKPASLETLCNSNGVDINTDLKQRIKGELKQNNAYFLQRNRDGSIPEQVKEYAAQDVTVLVDLYTKMERLLGEDMEPLYKRLINVPLYSHLKGVDCRRIYERDRALFSHVAEPDLVKLIVSPHIRRKSNRRFDKGNPRGTREHR